MKRIPSLLAIVLLVAWSSSASAEQFWEFHTVDQPTGSFNSVGFNNSLALDTEGRPHISYMKNVFNAPAHLRYAVLDGTTWDIHTVDVGAATGSLVVGTLALDGDDRPHISYGDGAAFKLAVLDEDAWGVTTFGDVDRTNYRANSLTLDATGTPHVSFKFDYTPESGFPNDSGLGYATIDGANWTPTTVEATDEHGGLGRASRLALDADGLGHVVYRGDIWEVKYAGQLSDGTTWIPETVADDFATSHASLALDSQNRPHLTIGKDGDLTHAFHDGAAWQFEAFADTASATSSLVLDDQDMPHIAFTRPLQSDPGVSPGLFYARFDGQTWHTELVRIGQSLIDPSLALDADGMPHISYHDMSGGARNLQYAVLVPEPTSLTLLGVGAALLLTRRHRTTRPHSQRTGLGDLSGTPIDRHVRQRMIRAAAAVPVAAGNAALIGGESTDVDDRFNGGGGMMARDGSKRFHRETPGGRRRGLGFDGGGQVGAGRGAGRAAGRRLLVRDRPV